MNKHIVKHIVVCSLLVKLHFVDSVKGPLLAHRVPPVTRGEKRLLILSFPSIVCVVPDGHCSRGRDVLCCRGENETVRCLSEAGLIQR